MQYGYPDPDFAKILGLPSNEKEFILEVNLALLNYHLCFHWDGTTINSLKMLQLNIIDFEWMQDEGGYCCHLEEEIDQLVNVFRDFGVWDLL